MAKQQRTSARSHERMSVRRQGFVLWPILCVTLVIAAHPVSCEDFWWELAKGRAVIDGALNPAQVLIAGSATSESSWLSGVLFYLIYSYLGISGLMFLKAGVAVAICRRLLSSSTWLPYLHMAVVTSSLLAAREAWEPSPVFFDAIGIVVVLLLAAFWMEKPVLGRLAMLLVAIVCWANFGPRSVAGVLLALVVIFRAEIGRGIKTASLLLVLAAICLTPAGWGIFYNSGAILCPPIAAEIDVLRLAGWQPWWELIGRSEGIAFAMLTVLSGVSAVVQGARREIVTLIVAQVLAGMSSANLPLASLLLAASPILKSFPVALSAAVQTKETKYSGRSPKTVCAGLIGVVCLLAIFPWDRCGSGPGWGLDPRLRADAFSASLSATAFTGTAHCVGVREAGLLSWHVQKGIKPFDTPTTAMLNGRLREHVLLTTDLSKGWQVPHRRPDGTWGGWWTTLNKRQTAAIILPSEHVRLIAALEPTIWKPLSLNSVSIVYGKAGDPGCTRQIINVLSLRQLVDWGAWMYDPSSEQDSSLVDISAYLIGDPAEYESLRLAQVFRAMGMHCGALKVLSVFSHSFPEKMRDEFAANQLALGYRERVDSSRSSRLRMLAFQFSAGPDSSGRKMQQVLNWPASETEEQNDSLSEAARLYVAGDINSALRELSEDFPEDSYAKAMLLLESGRVEFAGPLLEDFLTRFSDHRLASSVKNVLSSLSP